MRGKVVLAGGGGFIGSFLSRRFVDEGWKVVVLSRRKADWKDDRPGISFVHWDGKGAGAWAEELEGAGLLVNLAGKSVDCRYHQRNKRIIFDSRTDSTEALGEAVRRAAAPPPLWVNSSTATIYRHAEDRPMDEAGGELGTGFSVEVAKKWEKTFFEAGTPRTRKVALRTAIVLGKAGGVLTPFKNLVRFGLGGVQGKGTQRFSWIHEEDLFGIVRFLQAGTLEGVVNASAPGPVTNYDFMKALRARMRVPFGLPSPEGLLALGAWIIRTEPELILKSRWVLPGRLLQAGYRFRYPDIAGALESLV